MGQFKAVGVRGGKAMTTTIKASDATTARAMLRQQGFYVKQLSEQKAFSFDFAEMSVAMASIDTRDKAVFSRQFSALINAGVSIVRSLTILAEQTSNVKFRRYLFAVKSEVEQGKELSDAIRGYPDAFDSLYCSMVEAGEIGGVLDEVLERLAKLLEDVDKLTKQIKSAMTYPVVVTLLAVAIFLGMVIFILPTFEGIFAELGGELPAFTRFFLAISDVLRNPAFSGTLIVVLIAAGFLARRFYMTPAGRETVDSLSLKIPLFGDLIQKTAVARFCRTFGALSRSGVPILTTLEIVRDTAGNRVIANAIDGSRQSISAGGQIAPALDQRKVFPAMAIQMLSIGEETGELDTMLNKVADFYEIEVEQAVKSLTSLIEPLMIVVLGGMVGCIILAMYMPMFAIFDLVQ